MDDKLLLKWTWKQEADKVVYDDQWIGVAKLAEIRMFPLQPLETINFVTT